MNALYYPFHLCHDHTLSRLLTDFSTVHFRDFMTLQLTPMVGTTAFPDGDALFILVQLIEKGNNYENGV